MLRTRYGEDVITLDELDADRGAAQGPQAKMRLRLLSGVGGVSPTSGMGFVAATSKNTGGEQFEASFRSLMAGLEARGTQPQGAAAGGRTSVGLSHTESTRVVLS